ncbi:XRE family transcriptional regulator [Kribbella italica]|uniref:helix-turn-helix domain-containing protein n=1 Tax=Kribbella italica TaxID=1540520 RepID=UPI00308028A4
MSEELERAIAAAGPRLRQLRTQRQLTLDVVAGESGISKSTLSRLESGQRRASLEMLFPLARIYGVTLDELVSAPPTGDPRIHLRPVVRDGVTMLPLTRRPGGIQAYKMIYPPGAATDPDLNVHEGYEWVYVMTGRLRLVLAGHDLLLGPGEAAEFDTRTPHWFGTPPSGAAEILSLFGQQGERVHVRARSRSS